MIRTSMVILGLMVCGAAAGRYEAENAVRKVEADIARLEAVRDRELREIQVLRAEVALLESPERLASFAETYTDLRPVAGDQLMTADDFAMAYGGRDGVAPVYAEERQPPSLRSRNLAIAGFSGGASRD